MLTGISRNIENALGNIFLGAVVKWVMTVPVALKCSKRNLGVRVFNKACGLFVRASNCFLAFLFVLFSLVLLDVSV